MCSLEYVILLVYAKYNINSNVIKICKCSAVANIATATLTSLIHSNFIHPEIFNDNFSYTLLKISQPLLRTVHTFIVLAKMSVFKIRLRVYILSTHQQMHFLLTWRGLNLY